MGKDNRVTLVRVSSNEKNGTHGVLLDDGVPFALTLEPPDLGNKPFISCIPAGLYICKYISSPRFGATYQIMDVPERSHILFHKGNFTKDTSGCVLVGEQFEAVGKHESAVVSSGKGFNEFINRMFFEGEHRDFALNIIDGYK